MSSGILLPGADDPMMQKAQAINEQQAMHQAMVEDFLNTTTSRIYAECVAPLLNASKDLNKIVPDLQERAMKSRAAAAILGQTLGMIQINTRPRPPRPAPPAPVEDPK